VPRGHLRAGPQRQVLHRQRARRGLLLLLLRRHHRHFPRQQTPEAPRRLLLRPLRAAPAVPRAAGLGPVGAAHAPGAPAAGPQYYLSVCEKENHHGERCLDASGQGMDSYACVVPPPSPRPPSPAETQGVLTAVSSPPFPGVYHRCTRRRPGCGATVSLHFLFLFLFALPPVPGGIPQVHTEEAQVRGHRPAENLGSTVSLRSLSEYAPALAGRGLPDAPRGGAMSSGRGPDPARSMSLSSATSMQVLYHTVQ